MKNEENWHDLSRKYSLKRKNRKRAKKLENRFEALRPFGDKRDFWFGGHCGNEALLKCVIFKISPSKPIKDRKLGSKKRIRKERRRLSRDIDNTICLCEGCVRSHIEAFREFHFLKLR